MPRIPQLTPQDQDTFDSLFNQWQGKQFRNWLRTTYFDAKQPLKDLGISIPPQLRNIETVLGWPAKGVNSLARRCVWDGFVVPGDDADPFGLAQIASENNLDTEIPQGITSSLIHSTAFIATTTGDVQSGEPEIVQTVRSALWGTGIWDRRKRALSSALSVVGTDTTGAASEFVMYLPDRVLEINATGGGRWQVFQQRNPLGRVPVQPLVYQPELDRPFGHSRITRAAMALTDQAIRTMLRAEVSAEFYSAPQRYLLGADESAFQDSNGNAVSKWKAVMGRFLAIGRDEETGELPQIGQFAQMSMEPHLAHLRQIAQNFASDQNLPVSALGIVQDNPASAEAIYAAKEELVVEAEGATRVFGQALVRAQRDAVQLRDGLDAATPELQQLRAKWRNPATPSMSSAADAVMKQVQTFPWMSDSDVPLEQLGYDDATVGRLRADRRRSQVGVLTSSLRSAAASALADPTVAEVAGSRGDGS
jgi:hypothetical protein